MNTFTLYFHLEISGTNSFVGYLANNLSHEQGGMIRRSYTLRWRFIDVTVAGLEVPTDDILTTLDPISSARPVRGIWQPWITNYAYISISHKRPLNYFSPTNFTNLRPGLNAVLHMSRTQLNWFTWIKFMWSTAFDPVKFDWFIWIGWGVLHGHSRRE